MIRVLLALAILSLASLACGGQFVATITPSPQPPQVVTQVTPVSTSTQPPTLPPSPVPTAADVATILRPVVNLRVEAGGAVVESVTAGTVVTVIDCGPEWCQVEYMEQIFYIWRGCLDGYADGRGCEAK
jgi:hypothetical protein